MRINVRLVRASQFFRKFDLIICHKLGKEHIILDTLSRLASTKRLSQNPEYAKLDVLFVYHMILVRINSDLVKCILNGYTFNK